ncbi:hypothetical protein LTR85_010339 [Meristemomyces frigidus]|nr:hypothetical protein LTR85_010339 [Meristemomyces frigidus]
MADRGGPPRRSTRNAVRNGEAPPPEELGLPPPTRGTRDGRGGSVRATPGTGRAASNRAPQGRANGGLSEPAIPPGLEEPPASPTRRTGDAPAGRNDSVAETATVAPPAVPEETPESGSTGKQGNSAEASPTPPSSNASSGKRDREDDDADEQPPAQKPKTSESGSEELNEEQQASSEVTHADPCDYMAERLQEFRALKERDRLAGRLGEDGYDNPIPGPNMLEDNAIFRCIASVTEAIGREGPQFSLVDHNAFQAMMTPGTDAENIAQTVARPLHELILPYVYETHTSLFVVRPDGPSEDGNVRFRVSNYDSAN